MISAYFKKNKSCARRFCVVPATRCCNYVELFLKTYIYFIQLHLRLGGLWKGKTCTRTLSLVPHCHNAICNNNYWLSTHIHLIQHLLKAGQLHARQRERKGGKDDEAACELSCIQYPRYAARCAVIMDYAGSCSSFPVIGYCFYLLIMSDRLRYCVLLLVVSLYSRV